MTIALIAINVVVYFGLQGGGILDGPSQSSVIDFGAIPFEITHPGDHCVETGQTSPAGPSAPPGSRRRG